MSARLVPNGMRHDGSWDAASRLEALTVAAARP